MIGSSEPLPNQFISSIRNSFRNCRAWRIASRSILKDWNVILSAETALFIASVIVHNNSHHCRVIYRSNGRCLYAAQAMKFNYRTERFAENLLFGQWVPLKRSHRCRLNGFVIYDKMTDICFPLVSRCTQMQPNQLRRAQFDRNIH